MLLEELTANLTLAAQIAAAKKKPTQVQVRQVIFDASLVGDAIEAQVVEDEAEDEDDEEDEEADVTQQEFDDSLTLLHTTLDTYDRLIEDDRIQIPDSLRMNLVARRIDIWDFLTEYLDEESLEKKNPERDALQRLADEL